jgi:hypothetical protein
MLGVYFSVSLDFVLIIVLVWHFLPSVPVFFCSVANKLTGVSSFFVRLEISKNTKTINWPNLVSSQVQGRIVATEHARTLTNFPLVFISYSLYLWHELSWAHSTQLNSWQPALYSYSTHSNHVRTNYLLKSTRTDETHPKQLGDTKTSLFCGFRYLFRPVRYLEHLGLTDSSRLWQVHRCKLESIYRVRRSSVTGCHETEREGHTWQDTSQRGVQEIIGEWESDDHVDVDCLTKGLVCLRMSSDPEESLCQTTRTGSLAVFLTPSLNPKTTDSIFASSDVTRRVSVFIVNLPHNHTCGT